MISYTNSKSIKFDWGVWTRDQPSKFYINGTINSHEGNFDDTIIFISLMC